MCAKRHAFTPFCSFHMVRCCFFTIRAPKSVFVLRSESFCLFFVFVFEGIGRYAACKAVRL